MIIIKSQDGKRIGEYSNLMYWESGGKWHIGGHKHISVNEQEWAGDYNLATYKLEERAKEVMAEIERHIERKEILKIDKLMISAQITKEGATVNLVEQWEQLLDDISESAIYTMPQE